MRKIILWNKSHPLLVILLLIIGSLAAIYKVGDVTIDSSAKSMMIQDDPDLCYYNETLEKFGSDNIVVIYINDKKLFTPKKLGIIDELINELGNIPGVYRVESLFSVTNFKGNDGILDNNPLMDFVPESEEEALVVRNDALKNPILIRNLISKDGTTTAVNLYLESGSNDPNFDINLAANIDKVLNVNKSNFESLYQIGTPYTRKTISEYILNDQKTILPLSLIILLLMLVITMRSASGAILPLLTSGFSVLMTIGFMGYMNIPLNILTFIIPSLIIVIGSTEDIHILSEYTEGMQENKNIRDKAIQFMASKVGTAIMLTALTTFLGFLSISINKIILLKQFGIAAAFGLFINPIVTCLIAPVYLHFFGSKKSKEKSKKCSLMDKLMGFFANKCLRYIHNNKKVVLTIVLGIAGIIGLFSYNVRVDNDTLGFFGKNSPILQRMNLLHDKLSGGQTFFIRINSGNKKAFKNPENLKQIEEIQKFIAKKGWFDKTISLANYIKFINKEMNNGNTSYNKIPDSRDLISQYTLFLHREEIESYITSDFSEANILVRHNITSSYELTKILKELKTGIKGIISPFFKFGITGESILINKAADTIAICQAQGIGLLLIVILVIMTILFYNFKAGFLSLLPNLFPVAINFGIMGIFNIPLNAGTCMVAVIAIGIAVDDTIHMMSRYNKEMRDLQDQDKAVDACIKSEIRPVFSTSIALAMGFSILAFSHLLPIVYFGILSGMVMIFAMVGDILITPILLSSTQLITIWDMTSLKLKKELTESSIFEGLNLRQIKKMILLGKVHERNSGEFLITKGEPGENMYVLLKGTVNVCDKDEKSGKEITLATLKNGEVFGEIALLEHSPRIANVIANGHVTYFTLNWKGLERIQRVFPRISNKIYLNLARILGQRVINLNHMVCHEGN